ncbi:glycoside hydrolase family 113 [Streptomyces griseorubiginosus]|uniref:glycoside hydrolase family 113 n=1 Tax=Streptomyces griseorubiginosus TaxID=67304 RepID=UPI0036EF71A5
MRKRFYGRVVLYGHVVPVRLYGLVVLALLLTAGCVSTNAQPVTPAPTSRTPAPAKVARPWRPGDPQLGAQVLWYAYPGETDASVRTNALRLVNHMVGKHMNALSVTFPFVTAGPTASRVTASAETPSVRHLAMLLDTAAAAGLRITVRPLLDEKSLVAQDPLAWRGSLAPTDRTAWFRSYEAFLRPYLTLAARHHANTFVLGVELTSLEDDQHWRTLIAAARRLFRGELSYDANWDDYVSRHVPVPVEHLGVDAYFPLPGLGDDATVAQIAAGWERWLDRKSTGKLPRIVLSEVGIIAEKGAYRHPAVWKGGGQPDFTVQKRWFEAACQVARDRDMAGLYWWNLDFHADPATPSDSLTSFLGRPAESALTSCFRTWPR